MKNTHLLPSVFMLGSLLFISSSSGEDTVSSSVSLPSKHCWWTTYGIGYSHTKDPFGMVFALNHSHRLGIHQLNLRTCYYNEVKIFGGSPHCYAFDIGLLYGPSLHKTLYLKKREGTTPLWWSMAFSLSGGVSSIFGITKGEYCYSTDFFESHYEKEKFITVGFPVNMELRIIPSNKIGLCINGSANINSTESFYSAWIGVSYGVQRTKRDSLKYIAEKAFSRKMKMRKAIPRIAFGCITLGSAAMAIATQFQIRDAERTSQDYVEFRNSNEDNETEYNKYNKMLKEEKEYINEKEKNRNILLGIGAASIVGLSISYAF
jgi:hypothetical protein